MAFSNDQTFITMTAPLVPFVERSQRWDNRVLYALSTVYADHLASWGVEFDEARGDLSGLVDQFFTETASWSLTAWEAELGLPPPLTGQSDAERRARVGSYRRGIGTANLFTITRIANAYQNGQIDVADDPEHHRLIVYFISIGGIPPNFPDLQAALRDIVPAHVTITYEFRYFRWSQLDAHNWTWGQVDGTTPGGPAGAPLTWDEWDKLS